MPNSEEIVLSSRVRLARNIDGFSFPEWASANELSQIKSLSKKAIKKSAKNLTLKDLTKTTELEKNLMAEQNLLSDEFIKGDSSAKAFAHNKSVCIMINEEDHIRLSMHKENLDLDSCWKEVDKIDTRLSNEIQFAFTNNMGFATSCPSNVGTGMRASVMLHLPALCIDGKIGSLISGLNDSHITVRGLFGEGSMAIGHIFQISNLNTLGISETETISYLKKICQTIIKKELVSRKNIIKRDKIGMQDKIRRAIGILKYTCLISYEEALDHLSLIILGQNLGLIKSVIKGVVPGNKPLKNLSDLSKQLGDGHLQKEARKKDTKALEIYRAKKIQSFLS